MRSRFRRALLVTLGFCVIQSCAESSGSQFVMSYRMISDVDDSWHIEAIGSASEDFGGEGCVVYLDPGDVVSFRRLALAGGRRVGNAPPSYMSLVRITDTSDGTFFSLGSVNDDFRDFDGGLYVVNSETWDRLKRFALDKVANLPCATAAGLAR